MTIWIGSAGGKKEVVDPYVGGAGGRKQVEKVWVGDAAGTPRLVFQRSVAPVLTLTVPRWDQVTASWTNSGAGITYKLKRGSTVVYTGAALTFTDTLLNPSTGYTYTLEALSGSQVMHTTSKSATTSAHPDLGLVASAASYQQINLSWSARNGSVDTFELKRGSTVIYTGAGTSKADTGLAASTGYSYTLTAKRGTTAIKTDTASASTPARPVSYGTAYSNVGWENFTGWTGSTQRNLGGPNIYVGVGGTFTNMHALVYGHGQNFRGEPRINGVAGPQQVYGSGRQHTNWPFNLGFGAGTFTTSMVVGGSNWGAAEWSPWTGQRWDYFLQVNHLDYWFYASAERDAEIRAEPWFKEELAERLLSKGDLYVETWSNEEGTATVKAKVTDRGTDEVLIEWELGE
jgi:hypothetical protein